MRNPVGYDRLKRLKNLARLGALIHSFLRCLIASSLRHLEIFSLLSLAGIIKLAGYIWMEMHDRARASGTKSYTYLVSSCFQRSCIDRART